MELKTLNKSVIIYDDLRIAEKEFSDKKSKFTIYHDYRLPLINKKFDKVYAVKEHNNKYYYNPYKAECTCDYHKINISIYPERNVNIICKHLYKKYSSAIFNNIIDELSLMLIKNSLFFNEKHLIKVQTKDDFILFGINGSDWMNVYVKQNERFIQFAFNTKQKRWSYNIPPINSYSIEMLIDKVLLLLK